MEIIHPCAVLVKLILYSYGGFMTKIHKLAACLFIGTLVFTGKEAIVLAAGDTVTGLELHTGEEPIAGIELTLNELFQSTDNAHEEVTKYLSKEQASEYNNLAFAKVTSYVNIRSEASEEGEILGKLYDNSAATILSEKDGWYQIESGSVKGYIKADFLITGEEAAALAKQIGSRMATVTTTTLKVREKASLESAVLTLVPEGDELKVLKEEEDWVKISLSESEYGYVSADYVTLRTEYEEAVSIEEEQERLEEEEAAMVSESTSQTYSTDASADSTSSAGSSSDSESTADSSDSDADILGLGSKIAAYAVQFVGNPYEWGGTSLTSGADCSGFTQSVFAHFGISIPRTSRTQANSGSKVSINDLEPGDLVFYTRNGTINHVALYIGNGKVISASSPSTGIRITSLYYRTPYKAVSYIN
jgi:peptidoglycan DL-endopeptidase CwlO